jgi:autotransporter-associated beta strand protein
MKTKITSKPSPVPKFNDYLNTRRGGWLALLTFAILAGVPAAFAATDTWNGASLASANWSDPTNWVAVTTPATNDFLVFDGATQLNNTNNLSTNAPFAGLTFAATAGGTFVLNGNAIAPSNSPAVTIEDDTTNSQVINLNIVPATNLVFNITAVGGSLTNNGVISGTKGVTLNGVGTLTLGTHNNTYTGGTTVNGGILQLNIGGSIGAIVNTLNINSGATVNALVTDALGYGVGTCVTNVNIAGGTFNIGLNGNESFLASYFLTGGTVSSTGGGSINMNTNATFNTFATNIISTISAPVAMRGGNLTYTVAAGTVPGGVDLLVSGTNFNNGGTGVLVKSGPGTMTMSAVNNTFNGGLVVTAGTLNLNGAGSLNSGNFAGYVTNNGTINFNSPANQTLTGGVFGTGALNINSNELIVVTGGSGTGPVTVAAGATNGVQLATAGGQWTIGSLTNGAGSYLDINLGNNAISASAPLNVNGNLAFNGAFNIIVRGTAGISSGAYPLIKYSGTLSGTPPTVPLTLPAGVTATIVNNTGNKSIDLNVTVGNQVIWAVGSGVWDINTTANWNGGAKYLDGQNTLFNDSASGTSPINITLNTTVNPASVTVNNTLKNYAIGGSGSISGQTGLTKLGSGALTLTGVNNYTNTTTLNGGTTTLDFTGGATNNIVPGSSALSLGGGTLNVIGIAATNSSQTFNGLTTTPGLSVISAAPVSGTNIPTLFLGNFAANQTPGATIEFVGPATIDINGNPVPATATINTLTAGTGAAGQIGRTANGQNGSSATVGLYDFAATIADPVGLGGYDVIGGSQVSGFYQTTGVTTTSADYDVNASGVNSLGNAAGAPAIRFNNNSALTVTFTATTAQDMQGILVTPTCGAFNETLAGGANGLEFERSSGAGNSYGVIWQNNPLGYLNVNCTLNGGRQAGQVNGLVQSGPGTVVYLQTDSYELPTYLNGGYSVIKADNAFGAINSGFIPLANGQPVNLNGGTIVGNATFTLDNGSSASARALVLGNVGGGLAVISGNTMTVDGVISGAAGSGPLWVGIPASSANGNTLGLLPGSGPGTANTTAANATGTLILNGANTYTGGTILYSGILNFSPGTIGNGAVTFNGGTLRWASGNTLDISANGVNILSGGGTLDVNGNTITLANPIGNGGSGGITLVSSAANGVLNLNGANTYTGSTTISGGTSLNVNNATGSATGAGNVTLLGGASLSGGGTISGNLTITNNGTTVSPGNGLGTLNVGGTLAVNSGALFNYEFNATPTNDLIVAGALTINDPSNSVAFNLYAANSTLPAAVNGTYNLIKYSGADPVLNSSWTTTAGFNPHIANPQVGSAYSFAAGGGYLTVTVSVDPTVKIGVWTNNVNANWSAGTNWSGNPNVPGSPGPGDSATFGVSTAFRIVTNDAPESVGGIKFTNGNSFLIAPGAGTLTLNNKGGVAPIYVTGGTSNTIQAAVGLTNALLVNVASGKSLAFSGTVSNVNPAVPATITINGAGNVALLGSNTYGPATPSSGFGTTLAAGTLQIGNNNALGAGDVAVTGNGAISAVAPVTVANNVDIQSGIAATVTNSVSLTLGGVISDGGALIKTGSGVMNLNQANTYSGGTTVNGGSIGISQDANLGSVLPVVLNNGGLLANATTSLDPNRNINIGLASGSTGATAFLDAAGGQVFTIPGTIGGAGNLGVNNLTINSLPGSSGTVLLSNGNGFNGTTLTANGTLQIANSLALQNSTLNYSNGTVVFDSSITAATLGGLTGTNYLNLTNLSAAAVALTVGNNNANTTYFGGLNAQGTAATLTKIGSGTTSLAGTNTYTGLTTVNAGTLAFTNGVSNVGLLAGKGFVVNGGTLICAPGTSTFASANNDFLESAGSVIVDTFVTDNNDGSLIAITGGSFSANSLQNARTLNNGAPTATAPVAAATTSGIYVNGTNAVVNLGQLIISRPGANSSSTARLDAGLVTVTNSVLVSDRSATTGRWDIFQVNGGVLNVLDTVNGIVIATSTGQGNDAELYLSGGVTMAGAINFGTAADTAAGTGFLIMTNASLYVGAGGIQQPSTAGYTSTIALRGGLIGSLASWSSPLPMQLNGTGITFQTAFTNGFGSSLSNNIELDGALSGSVVVTKTGGGILKLFGPNTLTGNILVQQGTLAVSNNSIASIPNIFVTNGAIFDVSIAPFTLGGTQTLQSGGTNNGSFNAGSGSKIYAGTDGTYGTNTFNNNLALANGALIILDVGTVHNGSNDLVNVGGNLALQVNTLHLKAPSTSALLDTNTDYVLMNIGGTISGSFASLPAWDVAPTNASRFTIVTDPVNKQVRLHAYPPGIVPPTAVGSASPSTVYALQTALFTVTVTPGSSPISSVILDTTPFGGAPLTLVSSNNSNVYTNSITFSSNPQVGGYQLAATVTDTAGNMGVASIPFNINPGLYWVGGAGDNNWGSGANWQGGLIPATTGSILTFAGAIRPTPNLEQPYSVAGITFDPSATAFTLGSANTYTLTLAGSVTNNSPNPQTFTMPMAITGTQNINTLSSNITIIGSIADGGSPGAINKQGTNTLTLTNNNTFSGGIDLEGGTGTLALMKDYASGYGPLSVASSSTVLLASGNAMAGSTFRMRGGSTLQLRADADTSFGTSDNNITAPSSTLTLTFDVNSLTPGVQNHTLSLGETLNFTSSADQTINITGNSTYTLALGNITLTTGSHVPYFNLFINTVAGGPNVSIASITTGNWGNDVEMNGGGNVTVTGNLGNTSNGSLQLYVNNGTTVTLQGISIKTGTGDGFKYDVVNGTLILDNGGALINNTTGAGLTQSVFVLGAATNIFSGSGYTHTNAVATNNNFNAAVYLGDTNNYANGGIFVGANITNNVSDGDVNFTNFGTFTIGSLSPNGYNFYAGPVILGWTPNRGKSVTLDCATGGNLIFQGSILQNGTDTTGGLTIGNGPNFAGTVALQAVNTYAGPTIISSGTLQLSGSALLTNSTPITVGSGTIFDVTQVGVFTLGAVKPQTLKGNGTVSGNLTTQAGSTLAPGNPVGTLTVQGNASISGLMAMSLNRTNTPVNCSQLSVSGTFTVGGPLTVTNIGPALQVGDTFHLFGSGVSGFSSVTIATNDANGVIYTWENDVATLGSVKVLTVTSLVNTNPATANFKVTSTGNSLQFKWAPDHLGWQLYTNAVGITVTNSWFPVPGSASVTNETITINPAKPNVFFQLRYP